MSCRGLRARFVLEMLVWHSCSLPTESLLHVLFREMVGEPLFSAGEEDFQVVMAFDRGMLVDCFGNTDLVCWWTQIMRIGTQFSRHDSLDTQD
mmetsp:Transcript_2689/g.4616  ORF Transcript_2689/g.4616 Transcript_2689/m.4616 type:complete len:93 (+) Transcript_2689:116-394(+)